MSTDCLGNVVTVADSASLAALNDFVEGFIASEARAVNILAAAETDESPIVQACAAAVHMFAESRDAPLAARPFLQRAQRTGACSTPREQRFIAAVGAWVEGDTERAAALHEEQAREFPRDLASLKLGQYHFFNAGDSPGMLRIALAARESASDVPFFHGMLAFAWEQCHFIEEAEASARRAIALRRKEPWAHHALAHVMLTQGRFEEGHAFMQDVAPTWTALNSFMVTHNWWHQALFAIELGRIEEALSLYDRQVWGVVKAYSQDQVNAVSLLARIELAGGDVGSRWQDVADHIAPRVDEHVLPFLDLHYLYGLARAARPEALLLLAGIEAHAGEAAGDAWRRVCVPAARGLLAHARGQWRAAMDHLGEALPRMTEIGGSHAQRDLFSQLQLDAMLHAGAYTGAQQLVQQQLRAQPESLRLRRLASRVYPALGLAALASLA
ncbi:MAG TPA: tetratricopeptide repeat protein [Ramlibacter sp.]|uniref:tetratricopeptide repeat protein n=1 Tax=Ramlibacter sp. TaxID=1917967 RepID=UPI002C7100AB|nr:tetratricopeptide repeat protein [Ramlibacter sp.]HVZ44562.1 tetratricopeptide repeat protein [Ramlibacter sp.]